MKKYLTNVKFFHIDIKCNRKNIDDVFSHDQMKKIFQNVKRICEIFATQRRSSFIKDILLRLLVTYDMKINVDVNYHVVFCLTFVDFFRLSEIIYENNEIWDFEFDFYYVIKNFIAFFINNITLTLSIFKIDFFRRDVAIFITTIENETCFLTSLNNFFTKFFKFFTTFFFDIDRKFFKKLINLEINQKLDETNIFKFFSYHDFFFKTNVVTWIKQMNLSNRKIKMLNRWKSNVFNIYIHNNVNMMLNVFKRFQRQRKKFFRKKIH